MEVFNKEAITALKGNMSPVRGAGTFDYNILGSPTSSAQSIKANILAAQTVAYKERKPGTRVRPETSLSRELRDLLVLVSAVYRLRNKMGNNSRYAVYYTQDNTLYPIQENNTWGLPTHVDKKLLNRMFNSLQTYTVKVFGKALLYGTKSTRKVKNPSSLERQFSVVQLKDEALLYVSNVPFGYVEKLQVHKVGYKSDVNAVNLTPIQDRSKKYTALVKLPQSQTLFTPASNRNIFPGLERGFALRQVLMMALNADRMINGRVSDIRPDQLVVLNSNDQQVASTLANAPVKQYLYITPLMLQYIPKIVEEARQQRFTTYRKVKIGGVTQEFRARAVQGNTEIMSMSSFMSMIPNMIKGDETQRKMLNNSYKAKDPQTRSQHEQLVREFDTLERSYIAMKIQRTSQENYDALALAKDKKGNLKYPVLGYVDEYDLLEVNTTLDKYNQFRQLVDDKQIQGSVTKVAE